MRHTARLLAVFAVGVLMLLGMAGRASAGINEWTTNGPYGGNIKAIAVSPDYANDHTIFAGTPLIPSSAGSAFKTTDGGDTWRQLSIRSINFAISPDYANDHTVYAVNMGGVFKSTDCGETWLKVFDGEAYSIAISPGYATDQTVFFLSGYEEYGGELYKTTDGGETWATFYDTDGWSTFFVHGTAIAISPNYTEDQTVFVAGVQIARTTDGGTTWEYLSIYYVLSLAISPAYESDHTVFAGTPSGVFKSTDNGINWELISPLGGGPMEENPIAISPDYANDRTIYINVGATGGVYKSVNGGSDWVQASFTLPPSAYYYPAVAQKSTLAISPDYANDHTLFAGQPGGYLGVLKTTDGGATWNRKDSGINAMAVSSLAISPDYAADHTVYAGAGVGVYKSVNGGIGWNAVSSGFSAVSLAISPNYATDHTVYAGAFGDGVFKSTDGGTSWTAVNTGITNLTIWSLVISPNYGTDHTVYAGTAYDGLFGSADGGASWGAVNNGITGTWIASLIISPDYASDLTVYAGMDDGVFKTTDGGCSWNAMSAGITDTWITSLAISPNYATDQTIYAGTYNGGVFKTTDGGETWAAVNTGITPDSYGHKWITSLAVSPNYASDHTVYAGSDYSGGVFKSTDGGASWTAVNTGLTNLSIMSLAVSPHYATDHTVYAGTDGGVFSYTAYTPLLLASLTPSTPSPALVGNMLTWTATATGGSGSYQFKFMLRSPAGVWSTVKDYTVPGNTWSWTPTAPGKYQVVCYVRNAGSAAAYESYINAGWYTVVWPPAVLTSLTPDVSPALINFGMGSTLVTWTATATGGSGSYEFKFLLRNPAGAWSTVKDYAIPGNTFSWVPSVVGKYQVVCYVRNAGSTAAYDSYINYGWYEVKYGKAQLASFNPSPLSPSIAGNMVTWTATGSGGSGSYQFKILLRNLAGVWTTVKDYAVPGNTWNWTPATTGKYQVVCYIRNQGSTVAYDSYINSGWYTVK